MDIKKIEKLMKLFEQSSISSMEIEEESFKLKLTKQIHDSNTQSTSLPVRQEWIQPPEQNSDEVQPQGDWVLSPIVGTYYAASSPDKAPYVHVGQRVEAGEVIGLIEAMKVMNEIQAPRAGVILKIEVSNSQLLEYQQRMFLIGENYD